ncbi:hypothetical protein Pla108_14150 [Botrimarina colliarenosi]|uniref:Uncharacterized protein n=1 Tax=Botrimarina colliarenosi TaxID=2528001 RepID=A0A5C6AQJ3_9BACT|nr:hypothetical protein [Botrimarina colliarenosi]TWU00464.1 hypothetical protein Pla108_14150 [Botrimarina colliarenosi]
MTDPELEALQSRCASLDRLVTRLLRQAEEEDLFDGFIANDR